MVQRFLDPFVLVAVLLPRSSRLFIIITTDTYITELLLSSYKEVLVLFAVV